MAIFSVSGVTSGIDFNELIDKLIEVERQPVKRLEAERDVYNEKSSAYTELSDKLSTLSDSVKTLKEATSFYVKSAAAVDEMVIDASASSTAATGSYTVTVTSLAQSHKIASDAIASDGDSISSAAGNFTFQVGTGTPVTVAVTAGMTMAELRAAINDAGSDVQATIINVGGTNPYRMILTSRQSGSANNITITENGTTLGFPTGPVSGGLTLQTAQDATFKVDGLDVTKSSNTVSDVIEGVTLTLKKAGTSSLTVSDDIEGITKNVNDFVEAYNDMVSYISGKSTYDSTTHIGGTFVGESTSRNLLNGLARILSSSVTGLPDNLSSLSQIGFSTNRDGTLTLNEAKLKTNLTGDLTGTAKIFLDETSGISTRIADYIETINNETSGSIAVRKKGLKGLIKETNDSISDLELRLVDTEERLRAQFANLEVLINTLSAQSSYLTGL